MKIFEIGTGYTSIPAQMGAATEIVVEELTRAFKKANEDVTIVDIKDKNRPQTDLPIAEAYMPGLFSTKSVVTLGIVHKLKRVLYSISLTFKLHKLINETPANEKIVLHFHNQYNMFFFEKLTSKKIRERVSIGYTVHSYIWFGQWENIKGIVKKKYFQEIYCCQHAEKVFVLNSIVEKMMADNLKVPQSRITKIINGVNTSVYNESSVDVQIQDAIKEKFNLNGKDVILQVGSVCDRKNQLDSIKSLTPLMKQNKNVVFAYAGGIIDAEYQNTICDYARQEKLEGQIIYLGEVSPGKELNAIYALSKIGIVNSKSEAFALVIAEALSVPRPVFIGATLLDNLELWNQYEGEGIIRITEHFTEEVSKLINDGEYYKAMQEKGRNLIVNRYSWEIAAQQYLESFKAL